MIDLVGEYCASLRRMPLSAAQELHSTFGIPWPSITATCPVPTRARFADKARSLYEPDEDGGAGWVIPATCVDPARPEEIEAVDPLDVVSTGPIVDLVAFHPHCRDRFALRIGHAVVLGAVEPQHLEPARVLVWGDIGPQARWDAEWQERKQQPLYEALAEAFEFSDPDLWRSNSFASLRPRLVVWMHSVVLDLQCDPVSPIPLMSTRNDLCKRVAQEVMDRFAIGGD
jgi:hypothetical protein